jgi:hypothetical protein
VVQVRNTSVLGLAAAAVVALSSCTGGGGSGTPATTSPTSTEKADKVYSEEELRDLVSGMTDADGNELRLYSPGQVAQGERIARLLLGQANVEPEDCKSIATAGLVDSVESGDVAVAISDSNEPRTLSAQSGADGPDAEALLKDISGKMGQCSEFTVAAVGQSTKITSEEVKADTDGKETFATLSTRGEGTSDMVMQVSAAEGRLLVVATKSGASLGDQDRKELEELVNTVLAKTDDGSSPTATRTPSPTGTQTGRTTSPSPTVTGTASPDTTATPTGGTTATTSP